MLTRILFAILIISSVRGYSQKKAAHKVNAIGISVPVIWNKSEATFYRLGSAMFPSGNATSYGINVNYLRTLYRGIYGIVGIGYFRQAFEIVRPFDYDSPNNFGYGTKSYKYDNVQLLLGVGYKLPVSKTFFLKSDIIYNHYSSFRQKYISTSPVSAQINHKPIGVGRMLNFNIGLHKNISKRICFGVGVILPLSTQWNNDEIFFKYDYSNDSQQIARTKFSVGTNITCTYNF